MNLSAVALVLLALSPVVVQQTTLPPAPGRLIEVTGGRKLHVHCTGQGSPTVVFEAGASSFAIDFALVQPEVAKTNRVCSYDRAGHGWSDARGQVDTAARIVSDFHAAFGAAGEKPPYVLVGASMGAIYARVYQLDHPDAVAGFVLVDPATEDRLFTMYRRTATAIAELSSEQLASTLPASGTFPVPRRKPQVGAPFDKLPPDLYKLRIEFDQRRIDALPASVTADGVREIQEGQRAALARVFESRRNESNPFVRVPVVVLTRGRDMSNGLVENHAALARLARNSRHTVVADAGHEVHLFTPAAVVQAIADVATAVAKKTQLPPR